jgi:2-polyprenyl-6-hydroxyphenyl methylase/3-demethylubiquinone-9 3-methyltransferase
MSHGLRWKIAQAFEIFWWRRYLRKKDPVEYAAWKRAYWNDYLVKLKSHVTLHEGDRVLDAGCGPAGIFMVLESYRPDAFDPLVESYEKLPHFKKTMYPTVRFWSASLEGFKPQEAYDKVFCMNAINHVDDLASSYDGLAAATKPGGTLVITIDAHKYRFFKGLFRLIPGDILHPHQYDEDEYAGMLQKRGFTVVDSQIMDGDVFFNRVMQVARKN